MSDNPDKFIFIMEEIRAMRKENQDQFGALRDDNKDLSERLARIEPKFNGEFDDLKAQVKENSEFVDNAKGASKLLLAIGIPSVLGILKHIFFGKL